MKEELRGKRRQLSKSEILRTVKYTEEAKKMIWTTPFTVVSTLFHYILWQSEGWGRERLVRYHQLVNKYNQMVYDGDITVEDMRQKLLSKAGFTVDVEYGTRKDIREKNHFLREMEYSLLQTNNAVNEQAQQHFLEHYCALMDLGFGRKRLNRCKNWLNAMLEKAARGELKVSDLQRELKDGLQMEFEVPVM